MERRTRDDKRRRIIQAARTEFAANGYHGTSIDSIIERAGVARATFYAYFRAKREVFEAALEELIAVVYQSLPPIDPEEAVTPQALRNLERVLGALLTDGDLTRILLTEGFGPDEEAREKLRRLHEGLVRYAEQTLELGQKIGLIREGDVRVMAAFLIGAVKEVVSQHLAGIRTRAEIDAFPGELLRTMLTGVGTGWGEATPS